MEKLDALRGLAIVWMALFHFSFDLNHFGLIRQNFYVDPFWTVQRACIVTLFMFCAGFGQAIAFDQGQPWPRFWRRWGQVAACALLVSLGSWLMFPRSFISFGVLHGMAVMLVLLFVAVAAGAFPVVRRLTRRLESLKQGVETFGAGQLSHRVEVSGRDEVAAVAQSFNQAAALAHVVGRRTGLPVEPTLLRRRKRTLRQVGIEKVLQGLTTIEEVRSSSNS